jgi:hypothetical protein
LPVRRHGVGARALLDDERCVAMGTFTWNELTIDGIRQLRVD